MLQYYILINFRYFFEEVTLLSSGLIKCIKYLDNETYYIFSKNGIMKKYCSVSDNSLTFSFFKKTAFTFKFGTDGYKLSADGKYLSLKYGRTGSSPSVFISDKLSEACEWTVEAFDQNALFAGICIRLSKKINDRFYYLSGDCVLSERKECLPLFTENISKWLLFGSVYMQYLGWIRCTDSNVTNTIRNYSHNVVTGLSRDNMTMLGGTKVIVSQSGGNFPKLKFASVTMNHVICEVIAVCNLLRLSGYSKCIDNTDFFRLAAEFEISGLYKPAAKKTIVRIGKSLKLKSFERIPTKKGAWGSDPDKIHLCLDAHRIPYKEYSINSLNCSAVTKEGSENRAVSKFNEELKNSCAGIISMNFDILYQAIHTFCVFPYEKKLQGVNVFCNHTAKNNYLNKNAPFLQRELYDDVEQILKQTKHSRYFTGIIIEKTKI